MIILVTGSRGWHDRDQIDLDLHHFKEVASLDGESLTVVHGDCPQGADKLTKQVCKKLGITQIPMPADWETHGKAAGPIRNQKMLDTHTPNVVLAYRAGGKSSGTDDMVRRADRAGIAVLMRHPHAREGDA